MLALKTPAIGRSPNRGDGASGTYLLDLRVFGRTFPQASVALVQTFLPTSPPSVSLVANVH